MSRARHKARASGGKLSSSPEWEAGGGSNAAKEAEEKKHGGKVHHHGEGGKSKHRADKRARGGSVARAGGGNVIARKHGGGVKTDGAGNHAEEVHSIKKHSMHHGRARGGRIGADKAPLTTAAKVKHITPGELPEDGHSSAQGDLEKVSAKVIKG